MRTSEAGDGVALSVDERDEVLAILAVHVPEFRVWVFGSRVTGRAKTFSDLDLGVEGPEELSLTRQAELAEAFEESALPFRVDVTDLGAADREFATRVRQKGVLLRLGSAPGSGSGFDEARLDRKPG